MGRNEIFGKLRYPSVSRKLKNMILFLERMVWYQFITTLSHYVENDNGFPLITLRRYDNRRYIFRYALSSVLFCFFFFGCFQCHLFSTDSLIIVWYFSNLSVKFFFLQSISFGFFSNLSIQIYFFLRYKTFVTFPDFRQYLI